MSVGSASGLFVYIFASFRFLLLTAEISKPETGKDDATVEGNGDGYGQVPPGQTEDEDGTIVNPGGNVAPGLNRGEHIDKPENPNKPDKPENPGTVALFESSERANQKQAPTAAVPLQIFSIIL